MNLYKVICNGMASRQQRKRVVERIPLEAVEVYSQIQPFSSSALPQADMVQKTRIMRCPCGCDEEAIYDPAKRISFHDGSISIRRDCIGGGYILTKIIDHAEGK